MAECGNMLKIKIFLYYDDRSLYSSLQLTTAVRVVCRIRRKIGKIALWCTVYYDRVLVIIIRTAVTEKSRPVCLFACLFEVWVLCSWVFSLGWRGQYFVISTSETNWLKQPVFLELLLRPGRGAEYCDQLVCLSVCPQALWNRWRDLHEIFMQIPCGRGSVLLWRYCDTICTSGFINDVTFGRSGPYGDAWKAEPLTSCH